MYIIGVSGVSTDQKAGRLAFCDTKCVSGETDGECMGASGFGVMGDYKGDKKVAVMRFIFNV